MSWLSPNRWLVEELFICHASGLSAAYRLPATWYDHNATQMPLIAMFACLDCGCKRF